MKVSLSKTRSITPLEIDIKVIAPRFVMCEMSLTSVLARSLHGHVDVRFLGDPAIGTQGRSAGLMVFVTTTCEADLAIA